MYATVHVDHVELQRVPLAVDTRYPEEDWSGITNQKERKKLQNRLNKRLSRQRKRANRYHGFSPACTTPDSTPPESSSPESTPSEPILSESAPHKLASPPTVPQYDSSAAAPLLANTSTTFSHCSREDVTQRRAFLNSFAEQALASYTAAYPCADHYLKLVQLNVITGFTKNAASLGLDFDWLICESVSPFGRNGRGTSPATAPASPVPASLVPTEKQLTTRHHPWLDLFPLPRLRDNLLLVVSAMTTDEEQLFFDHVMESGGGRDEWAGLVVWGDPWDPQSWEISVPFLGRWGHVLRGCPEMIASTNYWRRQRGEQPIASPRCVQEIA